jgi:ankyrin repeat protein
VTDSCLTRIDDLIRSGAEINAQRQDGSTPLHLCVYHGNVAGLNCLLDRGANPSIANNDGEFPLHLAARLGQLMCMQAIVLKTAACATYSVVPPAVQSPLHSNVQKTTPTCDTNAECDPAFRGPVPREGEYESRLAQAEEDEVVDVPNTQQYLPDASYTPANYQKTSSNDVYEDVVRSQQYLVPREEEAVPAQAEEVMTVRNTQLHSPLVSSIPAVFQQSNENDVYKAGVVAHERAIQDTSFNQESEKSGLSLAGSGSHGQNVVFDASRTTKRMYNGTRSNNTLNIASIRSRYGKQVASRSHQIGDRRPPDHVQLWENVVVEDIGALDVKYDEIFASPTAALKSNWYATHNWEELVAPSGDKYYYSRETESVQWDDPFVGSDEWLLYDGKRAADILVKRQELLIKKYQHSNSSPSNSTTSAATDGTLSSTIVGVGIPSTSSTPVTPSTQILGNNRSLSQSQVLQRKRSGMRTTTVEASTGAVSDCIRPDQVTVAPTTVDYIAPTSLQPQQTFSAGGDDSSGKLQTSMQSSSRRNPFVKSHHSSTGNDEGGGNITNGLKYHPSSYPGFDSTPVPSQSRFRSDSNSSPVSDLSDGTATASKSTANQSDRHMKVWERFFVNALQSRLGNLEEVDDALEGGRGSRRSAKRGRKITRRPSTTSNESTNNDIDGALGGSVATHSVNRRKVGANPRDRSKTMTSLGSPAAGQARWSEPMPAGDYEKLVSAALSAFTNENDKDGTTENINISEYRYGLLNEALLAAVSRGDITTIEGLLVRGANVDCVDAHIRSPCHHAARQGNTAVLAVLQDHNGDFNAQDATGRVPLHVAAYFGNSDALRFLLECAVDINSLDIAGNTALHLSARAGSLACCEVLLDYGADLNVVNYANLDPLSVALAVTPQTQGLQQVEEYLILHNSKLETEIEAGRAEYGNLDNHRDRSDENRPFTEESAGAYGTEPSTPARPWSNLIVDTSPGVLPKAGGGAARSHPQAQAAMSKNLPPPRGSRNPRAVWETAVNDARNSKLGIPHPSSSVQGDHMRSDGRNTAVPMKPRIGNAPESSKFPNIEFAPVDASVLASRNSMFGKVNPQQVGEREPIANEPPARRELRPEKVGSLVGSDNNESDDEDDEDPTEQEDAAGGLAGAVNGAVWGLASSLIGASLSLFAKDAKEKSAPQTHDVIKGGPANPTVKGTLETHGAKSAVKSTQSRSPTTNTARLLFEASRRSYAANDALQAPVTITPEAVQQRSLPKRHSEQLSRNVRDDADDEDVDDDEESVDGEDKVATFTRSILGSLVNNVKGAVQSFLPSRNQADALSSNYTGGSKKSSLNVNVDLNSPHEVS